MVSLFIIRSHRHDGFCFEDAIKLRGVLLTVVYRSVMLAVRCLCAWPVETSGRA